MQEVGARLMARAQLGRDVFPRGAPEGLRVTTRPVFDATLYDLLSAYATQRAKSALSRVRFKKRSVWSLAEARAALDQALAMDPSAAPRSPLGEAALKPIELPAGDSPETKLAELERQLDRGESGRALGAQELIPLLGSPEAGTAGRAARLLRRVDPAVAAPLLWERLTKLTSREQVQLTEDEILRIREIIDTGYRVEGDLRREVARPGYSQQLVRRLLLDNPHRVRVVMRPDTTRRDAEASLRGLRQWLQYLAETEGQKTLVLLSEGLVTDTPTDLEDVVRTAMRGRISVNVLLMDVPRADATLGPLPPTFTEDRELEARGLNDLASLTRGAIYQVVGTADRVFDRLASEISAYYLLSVEQVPSDTDGRDHRIDIAVGRSRVTLRSRQAFVMDSAGRVKSPEESLVESLRSPLGVTGVPLRVSTVTPTALNTYFFRARAASSKTLASPGAEPAIDLDTIKSWCADPDNQILVRPVLDLAEHRTSASYEIPPLLREQVILRDVTEQHRCTIAVGDRHRAIGCGARKLVVGRNRVGLMNAVERALGARDIGAAHREPHVLEADAVAREAREIGLYAHRRPDAALHRDVADAGHLGQALRHHRVSQITERAKRDRVGGQRQRYNRGVGGVHLRVGRRIGKIARQRRARGVDRRLHILCSAVDVTIELELQRDLADPERTRRDHASKRRNLPELPLQRSGDQRHHRVRARAGKLCGDLDGRKVDLRQRRHRQRPVAKPAAQQRGHGQKRSRNRTPDER